MPTYILISTVIFGLLMGSFFNVIIYRLPRHESIAYPASHCQNCSHSIRSWENIPVISWLILRGKCSECHTHISYRYPLIEILTATLSLLVVCKTGLHYTLIPSLIFIWVLLILFMIDLDTYTLPDVLTKTGMLIGLAFNVSAIWVTGFALTTPLNSILGVVIGYGVLWVIATLYVLLSGRHGMGGGDLKMLGMIGAFLGYESAFLVLFMAAVLGSITVSILALLGRKNLRVIPFGPYLALGGLVMLLWSKDITYAYWHYV